MGFGLSFDVLSIVAPTSLSVFAEPIPVFVLGPQVVHTVMGDRGIAPIFYLFVAFSVGQSCQTCLEDCTIFCLHKICIAVASPHNDAFAAVVVPRNSAARFVKIGEVFLGAAITTTAIARWTVASAIFSHG